MNLVTKMLPKTSFKYPLLYALNFSSEPVILVQNMFLYLWLFRVNFNRWLEEFRTYSSVFDNLVTLVPKHFISETTKLPDKISRI